ncbi:hypothetical protein FRC08_015999 [Ceratobasidium sp. 394]|nr:hypothetical protein FRC08_015999 [Ceratobasidium sp. 394]
MASRYINAETTSGGLPAWVSNLGGLSRSDAPEFTEAWKPYIIAASKYIAPYQYPDGPVILVQSENEFNGDDPRRRAYMKLIEETMRANGVTKVPLTHNDWRAAGQYASGEAKVDLYGWDGYPAGFDCSNPTSWKEVDSGLDEAHQRYNPAEPLYLAEYQGGSYDPWNGPGYNACYNLTNDQFANVFYKNNYAAGTYIQSLYMTYGGTNWGNLATPKVYTSYDYGAAISEDRSLTPKFSEIKLQALFLHASPNYHFAGRIGTGTGFTNSDQIFTTNLATLSGQSFYIVRQTTNSNTNRVEFKLKVNTKAGDLTIPQYGGSMALDGRESKILVTEYPFGRSVLRYTTAEASAPRLVSAQIDRYVNRLRLGLLSTEWTILCCTRRTKQSKRSSRQMPGAPRLLPRSSLCAWPTGRRLSLAQLPALDLRSSGLARLLCGSQTRPGSRREYGLLVSAAGRAETVSTT